MTSTHASVAVPMESLKKKTGKQQTLSFENLCFKAGSREILKGMSAVVKPGEVVAIMGPSGAGKTSLLNILAGRVSSDRKKTITGRIMVNDQEIEPASFRTSVAYVMQNDALLPFTTPREALRFSAYLRRASSESRAEKDQVVEAMIDSLRLRTCADTYVGNEFVKGLSGGEKKRCAIGVELVTDPEIIFLDEPTSGLDSFGAKSTIEMLKDIAAEGKLVLCTIHQPSSEIFALFDKCIFLARGEVIYAGAVKDLEPTWRAAGYAMPEHYNPSDYVMYQMQTEPQEKLLEVRKRNLSQLPSDLQVKPTGHRGAAEKAVAFLASNGLFATRHVQAPWLVQLYMLFKRELLNVARNRGGLIARYSIPIFLNLLYGLIFFQAGKGSDLTTHYGAAVMIMVGAMFGSAQPMILAFPLERPIFLREFATNTYSGSAYFISKAVVDAPLALLNAVLAMLVTYWLIAFQGSLILLILEYFALGQVAAASALVLGSVAASTEVAMQVTPLVFVPQLLFAGFFIKISQIPVWLRWAQWLCSLKFTLNLVMATEFGECSLKGQKDGNYSEFGNCTFLIDANSVNLATPWRDAGVLIGLFFGFQLVAYIALTQKANGNLY